MIDLGQALTAQDRRDGARRSPFADQRERQARNTAIATDKESDWQAWRAMRAARLGRA